MYGVGAVGSSVHVERRSDEAHVYRLAGELLAPLLMMYDSLVQCGLRALADGRLRDLMRRLQVRNFVLASFTHLAV